MTGSTTHQFLFAPGQWVGEGCVAFNTSMETIKFHTGWDITEPSESEFLCVHTVELAGIKDKVVNRLKISSVTPIGFVVHLTNDMVEDIPGVGVIDSNKVAWEFRGYDGFEGFEVYTLTDDDKYQFHAEYLSSNQFRTIIDGTIWKKADKK